MTRRGWRGWVPLLVLVVVIGYLYTHRTGTFTPTPPTTDSAAPTSRRDAPSLPAFLPPEARHTLKLIANDGPFPHAQDGSVFGNYERLLPSEPSGYYHEYTVETPGARDRGARRIVTGGDPPVVYYYTDDHYRSFRKFTVPR